MSNDASAASAPDAAAQATAAQRMWSLSNGELFDTDLPAEVAPYAHAGLVAGQNLQRAVLDLWLAAREELGGWKIAFTSRTARDSMGPGYRPFGYILKSRIFDNGAKIEVGSIPFCKVEPELSVLLGEDLEGPDVTVEQARAAIASVAPAYEINSVRLPAGSPFAIRIANTMNNWGLVIGPEHAPDTDLSAQGITLLADGERVGSATSGPDVLDDPYLSLTRVCASLATSGLGLKAGQRVITGSLMAATPLEGRSVFEAQWGALGDVTVTFV